MAVLAARQLCLPVPLPLCVLTQFLTSPPRPPRALARPCRCLTTTGADYAKFLAAQLTASVLSKELVAESEKDHTPWQKGGYQLYGLYGFGHFLECFDSYRGFTKK